MKPLHTGLLIAGATLAGALAFKMTQQPLIPDPPPLARLNAPPAPLPVIPSQPKPSPLTAPAAKIAAAPPSAEAAPAPVYQEPARVLAKQQPAPAPKLIAKLTPPAKVPPTQWAPTKYQSPASDNPKPEAAKSEPVPEQPQAQVAAAPEPAPAPEPSPAPAPTPRQVTLRTGMTVAVRLDETLSSSGAASGDSFQASLAEPLVVDGLVIAERGARAVGRIVETDRGMISLALASVYTSDGQRVALLTDPWTRQSEPSFFFRRAANVPTGTVIHFRLSNRVTVTEQLGQLAAR